jgi:hypothetical protein
MLLSISRPFFTLKMFELGPLLLLDTLIAGYRLVLAFMVAGNAECNL